MSVFDPAPIPQGREPLAGDIIGARWAVEMGNDKVPFLHEAEACIVCGAVAQTCTHAEGVRSDMAGARRAQTRRATPANRRQEQVVGEAELPRAEDIARATDARLSANPDDASVITDTRDEAGFTVDQPGIAAQDPPAVVDDPLVLSEVRTDIGEGPGNVGPAAPPATNALNPQGTPQPVDNRPAREAGEPDGFILSPGDLAKRIPVRRVEGRDGYVMAREDIYVRRIATGTTSMPIFTLLMSAGTIFPMGQLNTKVV